MSLSVKVGDLVVDRGARSVYRGDETLRLNGLTFDFLTALIDAAPNVATFDALTDTVWRTQIVTPETIAQRASMLRRGLGANDNSESYFEVVRGIGYRLVPSVESEVPASTSSSEISYRTSQTIAVMPFENLSNDPDQEFFCDGLVEDLIGALSQVRGLLVISRNSTFTFKRGETDVRDIADRLNVSWLLIGSVRRSGNRVRVSAQLVDTATEQMAWSNKFDGVLEDVFDLQDELTTEIVKALDIELVSGEEGRLRLSRNFSTQAREILYRGIYHHYAYERSSFDKAMDYFDQFVAMEPNSIVGYVWRVIALGFAGVVQWVSPAELLPQLHANLEKIFAIDPKDPQGLVGVIYPKVFSGDVSEAKAAVQEATQIAPNLDEAWFLLSWCEMLSGDSERAITSMTRAIRLSPVVPATRLGVLATCYRNAERYDESEQTFLSVIENYPDFVWAHTGLAITYGLAGNLDGARKQVALAIKKDPTYTVERYTSPDLYIDKSVMRTCGEMLKQAGMPSASN